MSNTGILIVGVGGQGTLMASKVMGEALLMDGFDVKVSEVHGMAQRGGSVVTHVKFGSKVLSPLVGIGQADFILAFEELEALRWADHLREKGVIIVNHQRILPMSVAQGEREYPDKIREKLKNALWVRATETALGCGSIKSANMVLLGVLASKLDIDKGLWQKAIREMVPRGTVEINLKAFEEGYKTSV